MYKIKTLLLTMILIMTGIYIVTAQYGNIADLTPLADKNIDIKNINIINISDNSAKITFEVNPNGVKTVIHYGTNSNNLNKLSNWNNKTTLKREIILDSLSNKTKYYFSIYAYNGSNSSKSPVKSFTTIGVTDPPNATVPKIDNINVGNITNNSAEITFTVNQSNADTIIRYDTKLSLDKRSGWNNNTDNIRTIKLSSLLNETKYNFSIYAYNGTDSKYYANSDTRNFTTLKTNITNNTNDTKPPKSITDLKNVTFASSYIDWTWQDPSDSDFDRVMIYINGASKPNITKGIRHYNATGLESSTEYTISTHTVDNTGNINKTWVNKSARTSNANPIITIIKEPDNLNVTIGTSLYFNIMVDQNINVTWKVGNDTVKSENILANKNSSYIFKPSSKTSYNIRVIATNDNGTDTKNWTVFVRSKTYSVGNRIWDGSKPNEYSLTYTWNPMSFSGFYYNINNNVGDESITMTLRDYQSRSIDEGKLVYSTTPDEVNFGYGEFGKYQVIGFMADKYFAGYTDNTRPPNPKESVKKVSVIAQGQLHKVLVDDDQKRILSVGSTLTLKEGYILKAKDVGDRTMLISLFKDGGEVDSASLLNAGETYVYKKRVGSADDLPIIMVRFETVFMGTETQMAVLKGMFQISENYIKVNTGDRYGAMEITEANANRIAMTNSNSVSLSAGNTIDLMGNLKIIVADNSSVVRFALSTDRTGTFDVRGTIYPITDEWTPMNFGSNIGGTSIGFYYDMDEDVGTERLKIDDIKGRSIPKNKLIYSTSPQEVNFIYSNFGSYSVIGFMADKYFAGYTDNSIISDKKKISTIGSGQLHKVLIDDDEKRVVSVGSTLTFKDGYVLKAKEIDVGAGSGQIWMVLLKDGNEIDNQVVSSGGIYVYSKKVGGVDELPLIAIHIDSVFRGREVNAAFVKGVFQIEDAYTKVGTGDNYKVMEITKTGQDEIVMENRDSISLSEGNTIDLMGNLKLRVADSGTLRFYPFVSVTLDMIANQLIIDAPVKATAGDTIKIKITAGGDTVEGASITIDPGIGLIESKTNENGTLEYTLSNTLKGKYNITATKLGYEKAIRGIEILEYIRNSLSINIPTVANQFEVMTISVASNNTPINGVSLTYDNVTIGITDNYGKLNYTLQNSGTHTITASKTGYITTSRDIDVRMPFSEFKGLDINVVPNTTFTGDNIIVKSNITNVGTKGDSLPVILVINGTEIDNKTITLVPNERKEVNFTYKVKLQKGNYTVQILEQHISLEVKEKPFNIILIAGIIIVIGAIIIFFLTKEKGLENLLAKLKKRE